MVNERQFGRQLALLRREAGYTQDELAGRLHVSPQAVSKWENGHSLPETALLPELARLLDVSVDALFNPGELVIHEALFGDGLASVSVAGRMRRLIEGDALSMPASAAFLGAEAAGERVSYLIVKYSARRGLCWAAFLEGEEVRLTSEDAPADPAEGELAIVAGRYGSKRHHYDVMPKIEHYRPFRWNEYRADHEVFPSDPANDCEEYLTLVYRNANGLHMATCREGERLAYAEQRTELARRAEADECYLPNVPNLPPFGAGMECSWAAALTAALASMGERATYAEVMGASGACYRLAFCSPGWDYSSVDGLVAYDYATPGFHAFGYTPEMHARVEKAERAGHRARILREIRSGMPVLGINLRVAPEWGLICGYEGGGESLFCRTKYDAESLREEPARSGGLNPYGYLYVDNWPFLLCYFAGKRKPPERREVLLASLATFADCAAREKEGGYFLGFAAYAAWAGDLRDEAFYEACGDEQLARRFGVNQFCTLALLDARGAARDYLTAAADLTEGGEVARMATLFGEIADLAAGTHRMLDSGEALDGPKSRQFWTRAMRLRQAETLDEMARLEKEALECARAILARVRRA